MLRTTSALGEDEDEDADVLQGDPGTSAERFGSGSHPPGSTAMRQDGPGPSSRVIQAGPEGGDPPGVR